MPHFTGVVQQTPPMYSAVKVNGQRLYKLARAGIEVEREPRTVEIYDIEIVEFDNPKLVLEVECGKGVYMRSLAHDLGGVLGCGGYVTDLVRSYSGGVSIDDAVTLEQLEEANKVQENGWLEYLHPIDSVLTGLRAVTVNHQAEQYLLERAVGGSRPGCPRCRIPGTVPNLQRRRPGSCPWHRCDLGSSTWKPVKVFQNLGPSPYAPKQSPR